MSLLAAASLCTAGVKWTENGVQVSTFVSNKESPQITYDGVGGAIIAWVDYRNGSADIYAQRLDSDGNRAWDANGVQVTIEGSDQVNPRILSDEAGGAIIAWVDYRSVTTAPDIYGQRLDSNGNPLWGVNGRPACAADGVQDMAEVTTDGNHGAIFTWQDQRAGSNGIDIYAQNLGGAGGSPVWAPDDGIAVCTAPNDQEVPKIVDGGGGGGAVITWMDYRTGTNYDVYAQKISAVGVPQWTADGKSICNDASDQRYPEIVPDGYGGAVMTWEDYRNSGSSGWDIYAQRALSDGSVPPPGTSWVPNGVALCTEVHDQRLPKITGDGGAGGITTWTDYRAADGTTDIYARRVNSEGVPQWTADGVPVSTAPNLQEDPRITGDGFCGAYITWEGYSASQYDIMAQKIDSSGNRWLPWPANGIPICIESHDQTSPQITTDRGRAAIIVWKDHRPGTYYEAYAQGVVTDPPCPLSVTPSGGNNTGIVDITDLSGTDFSTGATVALKKGAQTITATNVVVENSGKITCTFDLTGAEPGLWDVYVENNENQNGTLTSGFTVTDLPAISSITPSSGYVGATVTINGGNFGATQGTGRVYFGSVAATEYPSWSDTQVRAKVPSGAYGSCNMKVTTSGGNSNTVNFKVKPKIDTVSPQYGYTGTTITLSGSAFGSTQGQSSVWFGYSKATQYVSWSNTQVKVKIGAGANGQAHVKVMTSGGYSNAKAFEVRPRINSMSPVSGPAGTTVTLSGSAYGNVQGSSSVYFGSVKATSYTSWKNTQVKVKVPGGFTGTVSVRVYTAGGGSNTVSFTKT